MHAHVMQRAAMLAMQLDCDCDFDFVGQVLEHSGLVARYDWEGVYAVASSRVPRDVRGQALAVRFEIVDKRPRAALGARNITKGPYSVAVKLQVRASFA